jgi:hypothetical protein
MIGRAPTPDCRIFSMTTDIICFSVAISAKDLVSHEEVEYYRTYLEYALDCFHSDMRFDYTWG